MTHQPWNVPARIETERLVVRRYTAKDAPALHEVTLANVPHLLPWMAWAHKEPQTLQQRHELIDFFTAEFDAGRDYTLGMFRRADGEYLGGTGYHLSGNNLEIGYWLRNDAQGQGIVTEAAAALTHVALRHLGSSHIEAKIVPHNLRSRAVVQRLGYSLTDTRVGPCGGEEVLHELWVMTAADFPTSVAGGYPRPLIYDDADSEVPWLT